MSEALESLTLPEQLDLMADIVVPEPVSYTPQTEGWLVLVGLMLLAAAFMGWRYWWARRQNRYRRAALAELREIEGRFDVAGAPSEPVADLAALLRRTALAAFPRVEVASLYGESWLRFLDNTLGGSQFASDSGRLLVTVPYRSNAEISTEELKALAGLARRWIAGHRAEAPR
jgi:hypothetical protein